ncbi:D-sedoheptulose-7-phosphate isomerase [Zavarzinia compransoris]|uniref:Phosphoheptose isomerase n=1 Tax=Zavarzinia compransoris TaxID=1264899 RepID=A0A317E971_9PROT|nr:SIS domain-containing protein [Zavarzinia compransoris]PWR23122.1 phosphoheptose isomerase [Zavarzinia compransoris]TDP46324.1 D-sedoheptulose 7-phosphate isomerase [Zavarzinia compransoris]
MTGASDLQSLYPFLHGKAQDPARLADGLAASITEKARESRATNERFFTEQGPALLAAARALAGVYRRGGRLFTMGNGGSSCDAAHLAVEFLHPVTAGRPALAASNLGADLAQMTAVGNDVGFGHVFVRALGAQARRGDALAGFSTSGNSENLLAAFARAREIGLVTIGFTGGNGGRMAASGLLDHALVVPAASIHRIQECHVTAYHILWDLTHSLLADDRGSAAGEERE